MKKAWKGILGLLMAMTFTVSAGRMVYAETVDENHEVPDGVTVNGMELGGLTVKAAEDKLQQYMDEVCGGSVTLTVSGEDVTFATRILICMRRTVQLCRIYVRSAQRAI